MNKILLAGWACLFSLLALAQPSTNIAIIPEPVSIQKQTGTFILPKNISLGTSPHNDAKQVAAMLSAQLSVPTGYPVSVTSAKPTNTIQLLINTVYNNTLGNEGYSLEATTGKVVIKANKAAGLFYGTQNLTAVVAQGNSFENGAEKYGVENALCYRFRLSPVWLARTDV